MLNTIRLILYAICIGLIFSLFFAKQAEGDDEIVIVVKQDIKVYAFEQVLEKWGSNQWDAFDKIIEKESRWRDYVKNPKSSAYGLGQTMMSLYEKDLDADFRNNPYKQIDWTISYIESRYKTPQKALQFHLKNNWY